MFQSRKLAAIMFTDIVGYTALMEEDDEQAFELLKKNREIQGPIIEKYNGTLLKEIGDGILASFITISDAVYAAGEIQKTCQNENDLKLRIGIHAGEVRIDGDDVIGSGVNIASRLEPLAPVGGILVSGAVYKNIHNRKGVNATFVENKELRGVKEPVRIYQLKVEDFPQYDSALSTNPKVLYKGKELKPKRIAQGFFFYLVVVLVITALGIISYVQIGSSQDSSTDLGEEGQSIAILPFRNDSPDQENQYYANGMLEEILDKLYKIGGLNVLSRSAVEEYRDTAKDPREIAKELGVQNIVEGSLRINQGRFRLTVQLIKASTGYHLWSETYDGTLTDTIFTVQSIIAKEIARSLDAAISPEVEKIIDIPPSIDINAYDYILRAQEEQWKYWLYFDTAALNNAHRLYLKALELDPSYALGWVKLGSIYHDNHQFSEDYYEEYYLDSAMWYCDKALDLDPNLADAFHLKGFLFHKKGNKNLARDNYEKAQKLVQGGPVLWENAFRLGYIEIFDGNYNKGIELVKKAVNWARNSPRDHNNMLGRLANAYLLAGNYDQALNAFLRNEEIGLGCLGTPLVYIYQGEYEKSIDKVNDCCKEFPEAYVCIRLLALSYFQLQQFESSAKYYESIRQINLQYNIPQRDNLYREGFALAQLGKTVEGQKLIEEQLIQLQKRHSLKRPDGCDYHLAAIHASEGSLDEALYYLRSYKNSTFFPGDRNTTLPISFAKNDIMFRKLWNNKEFQKITSIDQF